MPDSVTNTSETLLHRQRAFLLYQLASAPGCTLVQSAANKAIPRQIRDEITLKPKDANDLRWQMVVAGWLTEEKVKRVVVYSITEAGRQRLRALDGYLPLLPARGSVNPPADERTGLAREVYVLTALDLAPHDTITKADLDLGFGGKNTPKAAELADKRPHLAVFRDQSCLGLNSATTRAVLNDLALRGDIQVHRTADSESYSLTPGGTLRLQRLRGECPVLPPTGKPRAAPNEAVQLGREAFVLLRLLQCAKYTLPGSAAAVGSYPKPLKLNHATAWVVRDGLVRRGYIAMHRDGNEGCYTLTPAGTRHLTTLRFDALGEVKVKGSALTELLLAAREGAKPTDGETLTPEQLESAVLEIFHALLRERFTVLDMVPIHEIRRIVTERFGPHGASHAVLDQTLLGMRRRDILRLVSISDRSRATPEQLQDSVVAVGETFFYARKAHAPAQAG